MGDSRDRFVSLAEARTMKAIRMIRLVGNLSNRSNYTYSESDVAKIFSRLERELKTARQKFTDSGRTERDIHFSLGD